jgi:hypothetical protein
MGGPCFPCVFKLFIWIAFFVWCLVPVLVLGVLTCVNAVGNAAQESTPTTTETGLTEEERRRLTEEERRRLTEEERREIDAIDGELAGIDAKLAKSAERIRMAAFAFVSLVAVFGYAAWCAFGSLIGLGLERTLVALNDVIPSNRVVDLSRYERNGNLVGCTLYVSQRELRET